MNELVTFNVCACTHGAKRSVRKGTKGEEERTKMMEGKKERLGRNGGRCAHRLLLGTALSDRLMAAVVEDRSINVLRSMEI